MLESFLGCCDGLCKSHYFYFDERSFGPNTFYYIGKINYHFSQFQKIERFIRHDASPRAKLNGSSQERIMRIEKDINILRIFLFDCCHNQIWAISSYLLYVVNMFEKSALSKLENKQLPFGEFSLKNI